MKVRIRPSTPNDAPAILALMRMPDSTQTPRKNGCRAICRCGATSLRGVIHDMRFLVPVVPGDRVDIDVKILKLAADVALLEGAVAVDKTIAARGRLGFARRALDTQPTEPTTDA